MWLLMFSWEASRLKNCRQSHAKTSFFIHVFVCFFEVLNGHLGSFWFLLGRSGAKMGPKFVAFFVQIVVKNMSKNV